MYHKFEEEGAEGHTPPPLFPPALQRIVRTAENNWRMNCGKDENMATNVLYFFCQFGHKMALRQVWKEAYSVAYLVSK